MPRRQAISVELSDRLRAELVKLAERNESSLAAAARMAIIAGIKQLNEPAEP